jgi:hypothetical protein
MRSGRFCGRSWRGRAPSADRPPHGSHANVVARSRPRDGPRIRAVEPDAPDWIDRSGYGAGRARRTRGWAATERHTGGGGGTLSASQVPVDVVNWGGQFLALNNRSVVALRRAGVDLEKWVTRDLTGIPQMEAKLSVRLLSNGHSSSDVIFALPGSASSAVRLGRRKRWRL